MTRPIRIAFAALVLAQACHSVEEFVFRLWEALAPARAVSDLFGVDPALGFAIANTALFGFGLWCLLVPIGRGWSSARPLLWGWALVEIANGCAHLALAVASAGYFPGLYTAPVLILAAVRLILLRAAGDD